MWQKNTELSNNTKDDVKTEPVEKEVIREIEKQQAVVQVWGTGPTQPALGRGHLSHTWLCQLLVCIMYRKEKQSLFFWPKQTIQISPQRKKKTELGVKACKYWAPCPHSLPPLLRS